MTGINVQTKSCSICGSVAEKRTEVKEFGSAMQNYRSYTPTCSSTLPEGQSPAGPSRDRRRTDSEQDRGTRSEGVAIATATVT